MKCPICNKEFAGRGKRCSDCYHRSRRGKSPWNKGKKLSKEHIEKIREAGKKKYKEGKLKNLTFKGLTHSKEWKEELSERFKKDNPVWKKGVKEKLSKARKGMKLSKEWRDKISKANQKEKNSNWQGGKTKEFLKVRANLSQKLRVWRKAIYERDNYTCQRCGEKNLKKPKAHHIKSFKDYPKLRVDINNGICLCNKCHKEVHYGKK